ncbi:MAG TPA: hypothetical protein VFB90_06855 [Dehalococcoidia bacterium]|nr:hypothetical protein [Dehalococcoidia bacterium]
MAIVFVAVAAAACGGGGSSFRLDESQPPEARAAFDSGFNLASQAVFNCASFSVPGSSLTGLACDTLVCVGDGYQPAECSANLLLRGQQQAESIAGLRGRARTAYNEGWLRGQENERSCSNQAVESACVLSRCSRQSGAFACLTRPAS